MFPDVSSFITKYKKDHGYKELAREMQRQESHLIYDCVCKRLCEHHKEIPIITIHDSLMTTTEHSGAIQRIIEEEYARAGLKATVKIKEAGE
jgi:hypothetical protein